MDGSASDSEFSIASTWAVPMAIVRRATERPGDRGSREKILDILECPQRTLLAGDAGRGWRVTRCGRSDGSRCRDARDLDQ